MKITVAIPKLFSRYFVEKFYAREYGHDTEHFSSLRGLGVVISLTCSPFSGIWLMHMLTYRKKVCPLLLHGKEFKNPAKVWSWRPKLTIHLLHTPRIQGRLEERLNGHWVLNIWKPKACKKYLMHELLISSSLRWFEGNGSLGWILVRKQRLIKDEGTPIIPMASA